MLTTLTGCATTAKLPNKYNMTGFYYHIQKGDTLYRIAKTYGINLDLLATINRIPNTTKIEVGRRLFIPKETPLLPREKNKTVSVLHLSGKDIFIWPTKGELISYFNQKTKNITNKGIDIKVNSGQEVIAAQDGEIWFCGELLKGYGKTIIIKHNDRLSTTYSRIGDVFVKAGDRVAEGQLIAKVGVVGRENIAYLHFEVRDGSNVRNPLYYLP